MSLNASPTVIANTASLTDQTANLKVLFHKGFDSFVTQWAVMKQFYTTRYEGQNMGLSFRVEEKPTGLGLAKETDEGDDFNAGMISPGYYKDITVYRRTYSLPFTWKFVYHNKYPDQVSDLMRETGWSIAYRLELDLTHPYTFGTSPTYTNIDGRTVDISAGDGLQLFYATHTLVNSTTTYRNILASNPQFSSAALEAAENLTNQQIYDNNGIRRPARKDTLICGSDQTTFNLMHKVLNSTSPREEANSGVWNPYQGKYRVVRAMWLDSDNKGNVDSTKSKMWMIVDSMNIGAYLYVTENPTVTTPTESNGGLNFFNENRTVKASACYEPVVLDPRFAILSLGDGSA